MLPAVELSVPSTVEFSWPAGLAMVALVVASGFFSSSETALFYLSRDELRTFRAGLDGQRLVWKLLADPDRLLTAVLFWNLLINLAYFSVSIVLVGQLAGNNPAATTLLTLSSLLAIILFGEVIPKSFAVVFRRRLAVLLCWPLAVMVRIFDPLAPSFLAVTRLVHRTCWPQLKSEPSLVAEDLEQAVENSELTTEVVRQERQLLHNILDLNEISVEEVMRPRGTWASATPPVQLKNLDEAALDTGYVVLRNNEDKIDRVIPLDHRTSLATGPLERLAEDVIQVPWCADLAHTLQRLREQFISVASVVNEYGETIGIVTYDDIIDTILSPEPSRARRLLRKEPVEEIGDSRYQVEALTTLRHLSRRLNLDYQPDPDGQVTVAGLLQEQLERIPAVGDECVWQGYRIRVIAAAGRGQLKVLVALQNDLLDDLPEFLEGGPR